MLLTLATRDFSFNKRAVIGGWLASLAFTIIGVLEGSAAGIVFALFLPLMVMMKQAVERSCYLDDLHDAHQFLVSMPVSREQIVVAKYVTGFAAAAVVQVDLVAVALIARAAGAVVAPLDWGLMAIGAAVALIYLAVFLGLYFRSGAPAAQQAPYLLIASFFVILGLKGPLAGAAGSLPAMAAPGLQWIALTAGLVGFALSCLLSARRFARRITA